MNVYILSMYGEYGAERVTATCDKSRVPALLEAYAVCYPHSSFDEDRDALAELLAEDCPSEGGHDLGHGWGGMMLHIVELDKSIAPDADRAV
jgi:hypothetical protein